MKSKMLISINIYKRIKSQREYLVDVTGKRNKERKRSQRKKPKRARKSTTNFRKEKSQINYASKTSILALALSLAVTTQYAAPSAMEPSSAETWLKPRLGLISHFKPLH